MQNEKLFLKMTRDFGSFRWHAGKFTWNLKPTPIEEEYHLPIFQSSKPPFLGSILVFQGKDAFFFSASIALHISVGTIRLHPGSFSGHSGDLSFPDFTWTWIHLPSALFPKSGRHNPSLPHVPKIRMLTSQDHVYILAVPPKNCQCLLQCFLYFRGRGCIYY